MRWAWFVNTRFFNSGASMAGLILLRKNEPQLPLDNWRWGQDSTVNLSNSKAQNQTCITSSFKEIRNLASSLLGSQQPQTFFKACKHLSGPQSFLQHESNWWKVILILVWNYPEANFSNLTSLNRIGQRFPVATENVCRHSESCTLHFLLLFFFLSGCRFLLDNGWSFL